MWAMNFTLDQLRAFLSITRLKSISKAAQELGMTQAALSIRLSRLEEQLETTLIVRSKAGLQLTEEGQEFLNFAETYESMEREFLEDRHPGPGLKGHLRVGVFSTVGRSLVLPALNSLLEKHEDVQFTYIVKEISELTTLLMSGEVDLILTDHKLFLNNLTQELLGHEQYVKITSATKACPEIYLNHDEKDLVSFRYFEHIGKPKASLKRRYLDEIYSVIDGVASGLGVSILPKHLIDHDRRIKIVNPRQQMPVPVYLTYRARAYYPKLMREAITELATSMKKQLS